MSGGRTNTNFGAAVDLHATIRLCVIHTLKFDLQPLAGQAVSLAKLRMFVANGSVGLQNVKQVPDNSWTEGALTYANRPVKGATIATFTPGISTGVWQEVEITSAVAAGAGSFLSLAVDTLSTDAYHFNSAEAATDRVELFIETGGEPGSPTPTPTARRRHTKRRPVP
jgi:hypothetical protein